MYRIGSKSGEQRGILNKIVEIKLQELSAEKRERRKELRNISVVDAVKSSLWLKSKSSKSGSSQETEDFKRPETKINTSTPISSIPNRASRVSTIHTRRTKQPSLWKTLPEYSTSSIGHSPDLSKQFYWLPLFLRDRSISCRNCSLIFGQTSPRSGTTSCLDYLHSS